MSNVSGNVSLLAARASQLSDYDGSVPALCQECDSYAGLCACSTSAAERDILLGLIADLENAFQPGEQPPAIESAIERAEARLQLLG